MRRAKVGIVKEWHSPHNDACRHNENVTRDCTCKRPVRRKPYRVVRVTDKGVSHNTNPRLVIELWPRDGTIIMREQRRRKRYSTTAADIYALLVRRAALAAIAKRKADRAARRLARKKERRRL
jgi:hypothetical protein